MGAAKHFAIIATWVRWLFKAILFLFSGTHKNTPKFSNYEKYLNHIELNTIDK